MTKIQYSALLGALSAGFFCVSGLGADATPTTTYQVEKTMVQKADALFDNPVVARGKGFEVRRGQIEDALIAHKANLAARNIPSDEPHEVTESNLLNRIIVTDILVQKATDEDRTKAKEAAEKFIAELKEQAKSEDLFKAQVRATGMTVEQFRQRALEQNTCEVVLHREIKGGMKISDEDIKKYYDEHPTEFEKREMVKAGHILLLTVDKTTGQPLPEDQAKEKEKKARELKERAEKGEDFLELAKKYSEDGNPADRGVEDTFSRGMRMKEYEAAAFSLKTNQISDVVETRLGYALIKVTEKIPAKKMELAEIKEKLTEFLSEREFQKALPDYLEKLKKDWAVEYPGKTPASK